MGCTHFLSQLYHSGLPAFLLLIIIIRSTAEAAEPKYCERVSYVQGPASWLDTKVIPGVFLLNFEHELEEPCIKRGKANDHGFDIIVVCLIAAECQNI